MLAVVVVIAVFGLSWMLTGEYTTAQTASRSFTIEQGFTKVRKIMVRTNATKQIITMGGTSEYVDQHWDEGSVLAEGENIGEALLQNVLSADPDWKLELTGVLQVRTLDEYVGQEVVTLDQAVTITPDLIHSTTDLTEGTERLLEYQMTTELLREENHTRVNLQLSQTIKTHAPWFAHGIADRRVRESVESTLAKQEEAMRALIEENQDKAGIFPFR